MSQISRDEAVPLLFSPITLRGVTARNRIVVSPMCQYVSVEGGPTDWHLVHLGKFAIGGAGIVFGEETAIEPRGRKTYDCAGMYDDRHIAQYGRINDFLKSMGSVPAIQLGHAGALGACHGAMQGWEPLTEKDAAQGLPPWECLSAGGGAGIKRAAVRLKMMDRDDIAAVMQAWKDATRRSLEAGFEILEIHGAHGYLIHEFLSPATNRRNDAYGGDLEGRMRFALEVVEAVRSVWPQDKPLFYRASVLDGKGGEWVLEDTIALAKALRERGVDVIDCSSGGITGDSRLLGIPRVPGYHVSHSTRIKQETGAPTMLVGLVTDAHQAEAILRNGQADLIGMARELMYESHWPVHAARELGVPNYLELFPEPYTFRLKIREEHKVQYPHGSEVLIPHSQDEVIRYRWEDAPGT